MYDFGEAVEACHLPMVDVYDPSKFEINNYNDAHKNTAIRLASNPTDSGHMSFLKLITVNMNVTATIKWWEQAQRYTHFDIGSSMSTMHGILSKRLKPEFHENTPEEIVEEFNALYARYLKGDLIYSHILYSIPAGLLLTARCTTNYLQLRTIYSQRRNHSLPEWKEFCDWIRSLPRAKEFITGYIDNNSYSDSE